MDLMAKEPQIGPCVSSSEEMKNKLLLEHEHERKTENSVSVGSQVLSTAKLDKWHYFSCYSDTQHKGDYHSKFEFHYKFLT